MVSGGAGGSLTGGTAGAVVSGGPGASEPATTTGGDEGQQAEQRPRREPRPEPEPFDLGAVGQDVVLDRLKKAAPAIAGGAVALVVVVWLLRRKR